VRLAKNASTGQDVAIKCINRKDLSADDEQSIRSEITIMKSLDHPNIVKFVDSFEEEKFFYVVLEFLPGGELFDRLVQKTFYTEKEARDTVRVICEGIKYCHDRGIVHRDLKPENLLMASVDDDANVKIADFGFATRAVGASLTVACGTPGYVAPELVSNKPYGKAVDMWAIGVITYCLLGGYPPFDAETDKLLFRKIRKAEFEFHPQFWNHISADGKLFISSLLQLDPEVRATADDALAHPWVRLLLTSPRLVCSLLCLCLTAQRAGNKPGPDRPHLYHLQSPLLPGISQVQGRSESTDGDQPPHGLHSQRQGGGEGLCRD
jgi:calcium/calmodulin-dependent protein kinase I